jgi:V/A-type H+/Na+-transporting ATPase subunit D
MPDAHRLLTGRAGQLRLRQRLAAAERGAGLLDRKLRILRQRQSRLHEQADRARRQWQEANAEARRWAVRATLLGGERAIRLAGATRPAILTLRWEQTMGLRYPSETAVDPGELSPPPGGTSALVLAAAAYRAALAAAGAAAAAADAAATVDAEVATTARRRHAIAHRLVPRLRTALATLDQLLEENERGEMTRLRWAAPPATGQRARTR